jgi:DNA-binding response OmpR family regulator
MRQGGIDAFICGFSGDADAKQDFLEAGADEMLLKPVSVALLNAALERGRTRV